MDEETVEQKEEKSAERWAEQMVDYLAALKAESLVS